MPRRPAPGHLFWKGRERTAEEFVRIMEEEERMIYEFEITHTLRMP